MAPNVEGGPAPAHPQVRVEKMPDLLQVPGCAVCGELSVLPSGSFLMGSPDGESGEMPREKPQHEVNVPSFAIARTEVTQAQWQAVMSGVELESAPGSWWGNMKGSIKYALDDYNPSGFKDCGADCPVERMSFNDAQLFIEELNRKTGEHYRLPTEAEWEYAARAGSTSTFYWGNVITDQEANYNASLVTMDNAPGHYREKTTRPTEFRPNDFGLYQIVGNVWEWTQDCWNETYEGAPTDGSAWLSGDCSQHIMRGGSWIDDPTRLRSAFRTKDKPGPEIRDYYAGFRLARDVDPK